MAEIPTVAVLDYWFLELGAEKWFETSAATDRDITRRFGAIYEEAHRIAAANPEDLALVTPGDHLAAIILFDQFPRNMFRGLPRSFATDGLARHLAHRAIELGHDVATALERRIFFYLPFEHSENLKDQELAVSLVRERCGTSNYLEYAELHRDIIARFGRFPHRNIILGRASTPQEEEYMHNGGKTFGAVPPAAR